MKFFEFLNDVSQRRELPFLLIGGIAVNLYGYSRDTHDVDLLVRRSDQREWKDLVLSLGYVLYREEQAFTQFTPDQEPAAWPLDLMVVAEETFSKMFVAAKEFSYGDAIVKVPTVEHLIALKLHVLKQNLPHRTIKDFCDIQGLVEHNNLDLHSPVMKEIFGRYGTDDLYRRLRIACGQ